VEAKTKNKLPFVLIDDPKRGLILKYKYTSFTFRTMNEDSDQGYGSGSEQDYVESTIAPTGVGAVAPSLPVDLLHIGSNQVLGIQKRTLVFHMTASPAQAVRTPALCECSFSELVQKEFQRVTAINNRANVGEEHREGEQDRIIPIALETIGYISNATFPVCCDIAKQVPQTLTSTRKTNVLVEPTNGAFVPYKQDIFSPTDLMTKDMLKIWEACDDTVLGMEFKTLPNKDGTENHLIPVNGVAHNILIRAPTLFDNFQVTEHLGETGYAIIPAPINKKLYDYMSNTINRIKSSFVSTQDFKATFAPLEGQWDDEQNLIGDAATLNHNKKVDFLGRAKSRTNRVAVHCEFKFLAVPKQVEIKK